MVIQERLEMLVSYVHYMYITNRTLDYNTADLDVLQSVSTYYLYSVSGVQSPAGRGVLG